MTNRITGHDELAYLGLILFKSQEQLERASIERAALMTSIASEMRTPLFVAQGDIQKFEELERGKLEPGFVKHLDRAGKNIDRVLILIDDLLSMETLEAGKVNLVKSKITAREIADVALAAVASLAKKKDIELVNQCEDTTIIADKDRLVQVLVNLLANALKFSAENTRVIAASEATPEAVKISIIDQGPGMDRETRDRVFEKYFQAQTPERKEGFGLGLAICNLLVQSHDGHLGVESEVGKGSTFWISIPRNDHRSIIA
jgi:signal transduction histidine kinase